MSPYVVILLLSGGVGARRRPTVGVLAILTADTA